MEQGSLIEEKVLLQRVAEGDHSSFARLYEEYADMTYGFVLAYTKTTESAEEIVQEIFIKLWLKREKLKDVSSFRNYLFILSRNHILDFLRKNLRERKYRHELKDYFITNVASPEQALLYKEAKNLIDNTIATLPPQQHLIYNLRRNEDMSLDEIAEKLNISRLTVRNHLNKALNSIRLSVINRSSNTTSLLLLLHLTVTMSLS